MRKLSLAQASHLMRWSCTGACLFGLVSSSAGADPSAAWKRYQHSGISISYPAGWSPSLKGRTLEVQSPDHSSLALVQLFNHDQGETPEGRVKKFASEQSQRFPGARVEHIEPQDCKTGKEAVATLTYKTASGQPGKAWVVSLIKPEVGYVYVMAAPASQMAAQRGTLVKVLSSFGFGDTPTAASAHSDSLAKVRYVGWTDPTEKAFTTEVPAGWKVDGGLHRVTPTDARVSYSLISSDGRISIVRGDVNLSVFVSPNPKLLVKPRDGARVPIIPGLEGTSLHYMPATDCVRLYASDRLSRTVHNLQLASTQDLPELGQKLTPPPSPHALPEFQTRVSAARATFTGTNEQGKSVAGSLLVACTRTGTSWTILPTVTYYPPDLTPADQASCEAVAEHLGLAEKVSPMWAANQARVTNQAIEQRVQFNRSWALQQEERAAAWSRQQHEEAMARIHAAYEAQNAKDDARHASVGQFIDYENSRTAHTRAFQDYILDRGNFVDSQGVVTKRSTQEYHYEAPNGDIIDSTVPLINTPGANIKELIQQRPTW